MRRASLAKVSDSSPSRFRRNALAASTGVLLGLGFPPFPFPVLAWGALVPLLILWAEQPSARKMYTDACIAFLVTFLVAFQWPLFHQNLNTALLSLPALVAIPLWMAVPFGISSACRKRLGNHAALALLAALFILMEWGLRRGPLASPLGAPRSFAGRIFSPQPAGPLRRRADSDRIRACRKCPWRHDPPVREDIDSEKS